MKLINPWTKTFTVASVAAALMLPSNGAIAGAHSIAGENHVNTLVAAATVALPSQSFQTSSLVRVPRTGTFDHAPVADAPLSLTVPANGRASGQLVVSTTDALNDVDAYLSAMRSATGATLTQPTVSVAYPRYIKDTNTGGVVADPLDKVANVDIPAGSNQPIWFTVQMPAGTAPGTYTGTLDVRSSGKSLQSRAFSVVVPAVTLRPVKDRPFVLDLWAHPDAIADSQGLAYWSESHFEAMKPYWKDLASAGQDIIDLAITEDPWLVDHKGEVRPQTASNYRSTVLWKFDGSKYSFDYRVFDRLVADQKAAGINGDIHAFAMLQFQQRDRLFYVDTRTNQGVSVPVTVGDKKYIEAWTAFLTDFTAHLKAKGWFESTKLAFDEQPIDRMNAAFKVLDAVNPEWRHKIALAANTLAEADIAESISFNSGFLKDVPQSLIDSRRAAGKTTLFYTWAQPTVPNTVMATPPLNNRLLAWIVEQKDLDGYLRWTYNSWPKDVYNEPVFRFAQGDEYIVYPGAHGPVSSTRWELFKDGLDDAELIDLAIAKLGKGNAAVKAALVFDPGQSATPESLAAVAKIRSDLLTALA